MRARAALPLLATLLIGGSIPAPHASATGAAVAVIKATPYEGHTGDSIDLSGSGLPPRSQVNFLMACPSWHGEGVYENKNFILKEGPITDARGEFAGYLLPAIRLHHVSPPMNCQIYASVPDAQIPFFPGVTPTTYEIQKNSTKLGRCQRALCIQHLVTRPQQVRAGLTERIEVRGWPGATVDIVLSYPTRDVHHLHRLDWKGDFELAVTVPAKVLNPMQVGITVRARLGRMQDTKHGNFTVTR